VYVHVPPLVEYVYCTLRFAAAQVAVEGATKPMLPTPVESIGRSSIGVPDVASFSDTAVKDEGGGAFLYEDAMVNATEFGTKINPLNNAFPLVSVLEGITAYVSVSVSITLHG